MENPGVEADYKILREIPEAENGDSVKYGVLVSFRPECGIIDSGHNSINGTVQSGYSTFPIAETAGKPLKKRRRPFSAFWRRSREGTLDSSERRGLWQERLCSPVMVFVLLFWISFFNYYDRGVLGGVIPSLKQDLKIDKQEAGLIASAFTLGYTITAPLFAWGDFWIRPTYLVAFGLVLSSCVVMGVMGGRVTEMSNSGVGEASFCGLSPTVVDDNAPDAVRSTWLAIFFSSIPVGAAAGYGVSGFVSEYLGWHWNFFIEGVIMLPLTMLCIVVPVSRSASGKERERGLGPKRKEADGSEVAALGKADIWGGLVALARNPIYVTACLGYGAYQFVMGALQNFVPDYLHEQMGFDIDFGNLAVGLVTVVTGLIGTFGGGVLLDKIGGSKGDAGLARAMKLCVISMILTMPLGFLAFWMKNRVVFFVIFVLAELTAFAIQGPVNAGILTAVAPRLRNIAMALSITVMHLTGDLPSPVIVGKLADMLGYKPAMLILMCYVSLAIVFWGMAWRLSVKRLRKKAADRIETDETQPLSGSINNVG